MLLDTYSKDRLDPIASFSSFSFSLLLLVSSFLVIGKSAPLKQLC